MSIVLGLNCSGFHSSACLVIDGQIRSAITEERLSRIKRDASFPHRAIRYCCEAANIKVEDFTDVFLGWNPVYYLHRSDNVLHEARQNRGKLSYLALNEMSRLQADTLQSVKQEIKSEHAHWRIHFVDHHKAHLANCFLQSGFEDADFLVLDGFGEMSTGFAGSVTPEKINVFSINRTPHSMGQFYSTFTEFVGFSREGDEWKAMALASLGNPDTYYDAIRRLIWVDDLNYEMDLSYFETYLFFTPHYFSPKLVKLLGEPLPRGQEPGQREWDIMAAVQQVIEETVFTLLLNLHKRSGGRNLVVGGGCFMNSVVNGKITHRTPYKSLFIGGSPDDSGISIGSALYGLRYEMGESVVRKQSQHNSFGRVYENDEIERELRRRKIRHIRLENPSQMAAEHIRAGKVVAWFQGASEFGQRALGNRSILADPTRAEAKDIVNATIKYREAFRPFAPAVLAERQHDIFETEGDQTAYFMEKVFPFREEWKARLPAVVHFDGSGRLQTVVRELNPLYYDMIVKFEELSGCPVVLNTSFNINGMPLVETPSDAIDCFYQSGLDTLILHNFMVEK